MNNSGKDFTKWVACWGTSTSITDRTEATYSKDLTLRYPVKLCFSGSKLRFHFSNLTGTEPVEISSAYVAKKQEDYSPVCITFGGKESVQIPCGKEILSDEIPFSVLSGDEIEVSMYFAGFTQMNAGTQLLSSFASGKFCYGNFARNKDFPQDLCRNTKWFYFLNTIDVLTEEQNRALICYGDSITCLSWPDFLSAYLEERGIRNVSVIRRAVCGTRILRQYDCITYAAYGLKGGVRFPVESAVSGAEAVIIHHGINDIIHPVGVEVNPFRPMSDMPTVQDLIDGVKNIYVDPARKAGLKVYSATLLPIFGWRTYCEEKETVRKEFNQWLRTSKDFDLCIDFDKAVCDPKKMEAFGPHCDSGDHLHPSETACQLMAKAVMDKVFEK